MKLKKVGASTVNKILKATVQKSGKLGFTRDAAEFLNLSIGQSANIMMDEDKPSDKNLYITINKDQNDQDAFKILKAGDYFYINLKYFYKHQREDYENGTIIYEINTIEIGGNSYFFFKRKGDGEKKEDDVE